VTFAEIIVQRVTAIKWTIDVAMTLAVVRVKIGMDAVKFC